MVVAWRAQRRRLGARRWGELACRLTGGECSRRHEIPRRGLGRARGAACSRWWWGKLGERVSGRGGEARRHWGVGGSGEKVWPTVAVEQRGIAREERDLRENRM